MARIRTIKPDFFTSEDIVGLSPLARLLYIATWLEADRAGRFPWRPKTLKLRYLPGDDCDIDALAHELIDAGLVVPYDIDGQQFAEIPSFTRHQVINNREAASEIPARVADASPTRDPRDNDASPTRDDARGTPLAGKERKEKEDASRRVRDTRVKFDPRGELLALGVTDPVLTDWLTLRKQKRAPVTETAIAGIKREADKAGISMHDALATCCKRGWQGFEAIWLKGGDGRGQQAESSSAFAGAV